MQISMHAWVHTAHTRHLVVQACVFKPIKKSNTHASESDQYRDRTVGREEEVNSQANLHLTSSPALVVTHHSRITPQHPNPNTKPGNIRFWQKQSPSSINESFCFPKQGDWPPNINSDIQAHKTTSNWLISLNQPFYTPEFQSISSNSLFCLPAIYSSCEARGLPTFYFFPRPETQNFHAIACSQWQSIIFGVGLTA